jgi:hypothetical protein
VNTGIFNQLLSLPSIGENAEAGDEVRDGTAEGAFLDSFYFRSADPVKEYTSESLNKSVMSSLTNASKKIIKASFHSIIINTIISPF